VKSFDTWLGFAVDCRRHGPGDEESPDIRDALKGIMRDDGGKGVHFSGPGLREHANKWVDKVSPWLEKQAVVKPR
jgi:hypothetical protein